MAARALKSRRHSTIRIGVSGCLLGQNVRYDGGNKYDAYIVRTLGRYFDLVAVCPEVAIGLGVPRPPIRLVGGRGAPRALGVEDPRLDVTEKLAAYGRRIGRVLDDVSGYIFKSRSPSCGVTAVPVHARHGTHTRPGTGVYADAFMARQPLLPVEEEDGLADPRRRDNFLERVFAYHRWQRLAAAGLTRARLRDFHARHRLAILARGQAHWRALERILAGLDRAGVKQTGVAYLRRFMQALTRPATRAGEARALARLADELVMDATPRRALKRAIAAFRAGVQPRRVPVRLIRRYLERRPDSRLAHEVYLYPDPVEAALRYRA